MTHLFQVSAHLEPGVSADRVNVSVGCHLCDYVVIVSVEIQDSFTAEILRDRGQWAGRMALSLVARHAVNTHSHHGGGR